MSEPKQIQNRAYAVAGLFVLVALAVLAKLISIQYAEGPQLRAQAKQEVFKKMPVKAERGNIYSTDGQLLATTMPVYDVHFDPVTVPSDSFLLRISALSQKLAQSLPSRNANEWAKFLSYERSQGNRYVTIASSLTYTQMQQLKSYPIFSYGRYLGGFITEQKNHRKMPLGKIAERTIGRQRRYSATGLEGAFNPILAGKNGARLKQKVSNNNWKPVTDYYEVEPQDGYDVVTTLNVRMQDIVHHALLKALYQFEADHGCAVLMETKTGAIRAIANLGRTKEGTYFEKRNYAVWESTEPGSTFKLASVMAALEDGIADTNTLIDTQNGTYTVYGKKVRDSNKKGYGLASLKTAFEKSSNVGIVKLVYENYRTQPQRFVDRLYALGLHRKLDLPIKGESAPYIPKPSDKSWSGISLPWMAYGYQVSFTPLQLLTFYNAVANQGVMVKPHFLEATQKHGQVINQTQPTVLNPAICSQETLRKLQILLKGVVENGTAQNLKNSTVSMAGKTGTCQLNYWKKETKDYQASFAGYFPAEDPKYSCIVVINKPNFYKGYYGSTVAAPVFKSIAEKVYSNVPQEIKKPKLQKNLLAEKSTQKVRIMPGAKIPNLSGKSGATVLSELENRGFKVQVKGNGKIRWQYPPAGTLLKGNEIIELKLG
jgi:cell division protein FtsI (penicillin-binding protein 3)